MTKMGFRSGLWFCLWWLGLAFFAALPLKAAVPLTQGYSEQVVHYAESWPTVSQIEADLPRIHQLLGATALRIQVSVQHLPTSQQLRAVQQLLQGQGLKLEVLLTDWSRETPETSQTEVSKPLGHWLDALPAQSRPLLILDCRTLSAADALYAQMQEWVPATHLALLTADKAQFIHWARALAVQPRLLLFAVQTPLHFLHRNIVALDRVMGARPWQIARFGGAEPMDEYRQAWWYRLVFYCSKKYGLAPAAVPLRDEHREGLLYPGLLRPDGSIRTSFWLSQIYFQTHRIDLDEHKLTAALYEYLPETYRKRQFKHAEDLARYFLWAHYKVTPEVNPLAYMAGKDTEVFYDYLQQRSEESLLNSHFSRLESLQVTEHRVLKQGEQESFRFEGDFLSSLGTFRFAQRIVLDKASERDPESWVVTRLGRPQLKNPLEQYRRSSEPVNLVLDTGDRNIQTQAYTDAQGQRYLAYRIPQIQSRPVMLQPLYLEDAQTGQVSIPHRLDFLFYKSLLPGSVAAGILPQLQTQQAQQIQTQHFQFQEAAVPYIQPRQFETQLRLQSHQIEMTVTNPLVERLLLPALRFSLSSDQMRVDFRTVLPEALLPLERRVYDLDLPPALRQSLSAGAQDWQVQTLQGEGFPILNLEINQDDAFRSKILDRPTQALVKYREVLLHFGRGLEPQRRWNLIHEIALLAAALEPERALNELDANLQTWLPRRSPDWGLYFHLAEILLQHQHGKAAIVAGRKALRLAPQEVKIWLFLAHAYERQNDWGQKIALLERGRQQMPQEREFLRQLVDAYEKLGNYTAGAKTLRAWLALEPSAQGFARLAYFCERRQHWSEALAAYLQAVRLRPEARWQFQVAHLFQRRGQNPQAIRYYRAYLGHCSQCQSSVYADLAYLYQKQGQWTLAMAMYRKHLALTASVSSRLALAELQQKQGLWREALHNYQWVWKSSHNAQHLAHLAYLALRAQEQEEAKNYFCRALAVKSAASVQQARQWRLSLAELYRRSGQSELALPLLQANLQQEGRMGDDEATLSQLLATYLETHQVAAGRAFLLRRSHWNFKQAKTHYLAGKIYQLSQDWARAVPALQMAICLSASPQVEYYRLLAAVYQAQGKSQEAIAWLKELDLYLTSGVRQGPSEALCSLL